MLGTPGTAKKVIQPVGVGKGKVGHTGKLVFAKRLCRGQRVDIHSLVFLCQLGIGIKQAGCLPVVLQGLHHAS